MEAVVLVSGGLDSAVCLARAVAQYGEDNVLALSMFYGQKHSKELECAKKVCEFFKVKHMIQDMSEVFKMSNCSLLAHSNQEIAKGSYAEQQENEKVAEGAVATYVPFRNGLFLSYATAIAYECGASFIYYGAHADDAAGNAYPDCSVDFYHKIDEAIFEGTGKKVQLIAPLIHLNKAGVVKMGVSLHVPFELTWSCYEGGEKACGKCGTCIDRIRAFHENNMLDPIEYADLAEEFAGYKSDYHVLPYTIRDGKVVSFDRDFLMWSLKLPYENTIQNKVVGVNRKSIIHEIIFAYKGKYYRTEYSVGTTEIQDKGPWGCENTIDVEEVECHKVEVDQWVPIDEDTPVVSK